MSIPNMLLAVLVGTFQDLNQPVILVISDACLPLNLTARAATVGRFQFFFSKVSDIATA